MKAEEMAVHACACAWVKETPDAQRMETVQRVAAALARAHAEGLEAGLRQAAEYAATRTAWRTYADLAEGIRSLIPAAPEVIK